MTDDRADRRSTVRFAGVIAVIVALVGLSLLTGIGPLADWVGLRSRTGLTVRGSPGGDTYLFEIALPPTSGEIDLEFDSIKGLEILRGAEPVAGEPDRFRIAACQSGCRVHLSAGPLHRSELTIQYLARDSEYLDDIVIEQTGVQTE